MWFYVAIKPYVQEINQIQMNTGSYLQATVWKKYFAWHVTVWKK